MYYCNQTFFLSRNNLARVEGGVFHIWEDFKAILDQAESKTLEPPSKIPPVLPNYEHPMDDEAAEGLDEQNLDGFEVKDTKVAAVDRHARLNELANRLGDLYGERPVVPKWATAERNCPNYYL